MFFFFHLSLTFLHAPMPEHSKIAAEESNVQSYIDSHKNFTSNVDVVDLASVPLVVDDAQAPWEAEKDVVLFLTLGDVWPKAAETSAALAAFFNAHPLLRASLEGKSDYEQVTPTRKIIAKVVKDVASRHNCPSRPDLLTKAVKHAVAATATKKTLYVVFFGEATHDLAVVSAVSRSVSRFTAKRKAALNAYQAEVPRIHVALQRPDGSCNHDEGAVRAFKAVSTGIQRCGRLVDAPTNLVDTVTFAAIAENWVAEMHIKGKDTVRIEVIKGDELRERGYGGLWGTGKAAQYPPHLVTLTYEPANGIAPQEKIALVGKGIVYDTGGLSIKSGPNMCGMKDDMGGAAAVFCGFTALVEVDAPAQIACVLCLADNAVGPLAQRNDDIILMKSGKTIEINNTDAEGRLVLGDGVYHATAELPFTPHLVVDMATLTGAQGIATGRLHAAIYCSTEDGEERFRRAGRVSGDLCFPVLYCPELHNAEFASNSADYRNSVTNRNNAQVSCAGQFIGNHLCDGFAGHVGARGYRLPCHEWQRFHRLWRQPPHGGDFPSLSRVGGIDAGCF
ncbi:aminopeptidase [Strigomonas culicis]|uniref:Aminopeptidase n=1 Tax=Strigomonas culicis TaxID=28005 RepID=S9U5D1_9TRYP|nr:aminopeptidase [Strigomonas culicis]|eukprot:EPY23974.1 aminopeptidase [Strigomonas culicis]